MPHIDFGNELSSLPKEVREIVHLVGPYYKNFTVNTNGT
jgi:guanyl-specific ribonuclease Sa